MYDALQLLYSLGGGHFLVKKGCDLVLMEMEQKISEARKKSLASHYHDKDSQKKGSLQINIG